MIYQVLMGEMGAESVPAAPVVEWIFASGMRIRRVGCLRNGAVVTRGKAEKIGGRWTPGLPAEGISGHI